VRTPSISDLFVAVMGNHAQAPQLNREGAAK
jgi:hypothetical protein